MEQWTLLGNRRDRKMFWGFRTKLFGCFETHKRLSILKQWIFQGIGGLQRGLAGSEAHWVWPYNIITSKFLSSSWYESGILINFEFHAHWLLELVALGKIPLWAKFVFSVPSFYCWCLAGLLFPTHLHEGGLVNIVQDLGSGRPEFKFHLRH